ncbi:hypothetical protein ACFOWE_25165 [Planomonospora corallina]|uniref:Uncharacterized protein n=1 Tax=Planomonospora corallina TaxID=1806052 RepID=A0ABV8IBK2_9ACTN
MLHYTRLGWNVHVGGSEQSALLRGLPVARTEIAVHAVAGTPLTGGSCCLLRAVPGPFVLTSIQTITSSEGALGSRWTKIFIGPPPSALLLLRRLIPARNAATLHASSDRGRM